MKFFSKIYENPRARAVSQLPTGQVDSTKSVVCARGFNRQNRNAADQDLPTIMPTKFSTMVTYE